MRSRTTAAMCLVLDLTSIRERMMREGTHRAPDLRLARNEKVCHWRHLMLMAVIWLISILLVGESHMPRRTSVFVCT
jgi:hypothetical protein